MKFMVHIPFVESLGFELLRFENGEADIAMSPRGEHMNGWSVVHGGVTMTLLDVAMAHAARSVGVAPVGDAESAGGVELLHAATAESARSDTAASEPAAPATPDPRGVVTVEMKTSFMRPGLGRLVAKARLLTQTQTMAFCEASMFDSTGALLAHATGTFKYLRALPVGDRQLKRLNASD
jgi:acyl-coenzyme A thioesterase PaaI-like protein